MNTNSESSFQDNQGEDGDIKKTDFESTDHPKRTFADSQKVKSNEFVSFVNAGAALVETAKEECNKDMTFCCPIP